MSSAGRTYEEAGVSLATAEGIVERLRAAVESTRTPGVEGSFGGFAGLYALDERRLLAASTDSVGSKLVLSRRAGRLHDAGRDLAAHCIDDVLTTGAEPLFFLDYVAAHRLDLEQVAEMVEGAAEVCRAAGCISRLTAFPASGNWRWMPKLTIAPNTAAPTAEPTIRINIIELVAMPRSFQPTAAWVETIKAVLQNPMPIPFNSAPVPAHVYANRAASAAIRVA